MVKLEQIHSEEKPVSLHEDALWLLRQRYLKKNEVGEVVEAPSEMFHRVAKSVAAAELQYDRNTEINRITREFYHVMSNLEFLPNSPTLMNAGNLGQLSACFVLPIEDSIDGIFTTLKLSALIQKSGAGTGFSFSRLRPRTDKVSSTMGDASGPIPFMQIFDATTDVMKQGGRRRGANIGILEVDHPDILDFIKAKSEGNSLPNFNLSVAITDEFMKKVQENETYHLIDPRTGEEAANLPARMVFRLIAESAWKTGDPGVIFIDELNKNNPTPQIGRIESTNPCGEVGLLPYESCNLGSINLSKMTEGRSIAWRRLRETIKVAVRFLDDVIDVNKYPSHEIEYQTKRNRKIGLGVMGFADLLCKLQIPYDSRNGLIMAEKIMSFVYQEAVETSTELAEERGPFPNINNSIWKERGCRPVRNATLTAIAPTGSISTIAGCSGGIEPLYAISYTRKIGDVPFPQVNTNFLEIAKSLGFYSAELMERIDETGSIQSMKEIPDKIRRIFVTAYDITPEWHILMQSAFQRHCDNAVSKTVNLRSDATVEDIERVFILAYESACKGITVFRNRSKQDQVLRSGSSRICFANGEVSLCSPVSVDSMTSHQGT